MTASARHRATPEKRSTSEGRVSNRGELVAGASCDSGLASRVGPGGEFNLFLQQQARPVERANHLDQHSKLLLILRTSHVDVNAGAGPLLGCRELHAQRQAAAAAALEREPARPSTRHKRQSSYVAMDWLLAGALCGLLLLVADATLVINIAKQRQPGRAQNGSLLSKRNAPADEEPQQSGKLVQEVEALHYLQRYGYMNDSLGPSSSLIAEESFHEAVTAFQRFAGIPETGAVDAQTMRFMQMPRCGNKDLGRAAEGGRKRRRRRRRRRRKRYALQGSKWRRQELTYRISQYPTRFQHKKHEVDGQIERAFKIWSQVAPIEFVVKREGRVHIDIRFASGEHGDGDPFDGPGNTLAHAYFPQYGGDAHFDDQEYWTVDSYAGTNIFQVAAHELGHSLGLGHSSVREALMAPFYQKYKPNFKLHADDVLAIQALYGERESGAAPSSGTTSTSSSTTTETPARRKSERGDAEPNENDDDEERDKPGTSFFGFGSGPGASKPVDLCLDPKIDAITRTEDGTTYVFRGQHYWQIKNEGLAAGPPGKISRDWDGLPGNLDAALTWSDGKTFFFKGDKYWRFFNKRREPGYPKQISVGFAGIPSNLDAAFVWSGNGKTYFMKRDKYWRFDSKQEPPVSSQYPKPLKNWVGLGSSVDAAFRWENGMTYFFKDDLYFRFDDRQFEVDSSARPAFPRSTAEWWFGCSGSSLAVRRRAELAAEQLEGESSAPRAQATSRSISRSLLAGLGSLLSPADSEWAFHRGASEETRRAARRGGSDGAATRWIFPLGLGSAGGAGAEAAERSLSAELRAPNSNASAATTSAL